MRRLNATIPSSLTSGLTHENRFSDDIPDDWPAAARVIHPLESATGELMSWAWAQPSMACLRPHQVPHHTRPGCARDGAGIAESLVGHLSPALWGALVPHLRRHSTTSVVRGAIWRGWSEISAQPPTWQAPWVRLEDAREYLLFEGTVNDVFDEPPGWDQDYAWNPAWAYLWAMDESWLTITGIDAYSTYIVGTVSLVDDIVTDGVLIAHRVDRTAPLPLPTAMDQKP